MDINCAGFSDFEVGVGFAHTPPASPRIDPYVDAALRAGVSAPAAADEARRVRRARRRRGRIRGSAGVPCSFSGSLAALSSRVPSRSTCARSRGAALRPPVALSDGFLFGVVRRRGFVRVPCKDPAVGRDDDRTDAIGRGAGGAVAAFGPRPASGNAGPAAERVGMQRVGRDLHAAQVFARSAGVPCGGVEAEFRAARRAEPTVAG